MRLIQYFFSILLLLPIWMQAQISTTPELPVADQPVIITFNSAEESRLGYFTGDLYAHTGVSTEEAGDWQHVIGSWGNNDVQPKLEYQGNGIYQLSIVPDINSFYSVSAGETVINMSFVFRNAAGTAQTNDLFVTVYQPGLSVDLQVPDNNAILEQKATVNIQATATETAALTLKVNGTTLAVTSGTSIIADYTFAEAGNYEVVVQAKAGANEAADTSMVLVRNAVELLALPAGSRKGIAYPDHQSVRLVLWAPGKAFVFLLSELSDWAPKNEYQLKKDGDYFWIELSGLETGKEYAFQYLIDGEIVVADPYTEKILDPWNDQYISADTYPGLLAYPTGKTDGIASVFQPGKSNYTWKFPQVEIPAKEEMIIYELLIRDFTGEHSYAAVIEKLDYLENLNINVLELMPVNEFEGNSGWGYNPSFYFAPDKYYGPANELKRLIDECHQRGIAVVIDMVLNHSYGQSPFVQMYMDNWTITSDNPWYNVHSNFQNPDAQWGYDFNHQAAATRELVDSVNSFWMNEYKVDGFRFDFTKGFSNTPYGPTSWGSNYDLPRINNLKRMADEIWKRKPGALVILEHLADNSEENALADHGMLLWGNMNHAYGEAAMGYTDNSDLSWGHYGQRGWSEPNLVTYQESHDEERNAYRCLNFGTSSGAYNIRNLDVALDRLALTALFHLPLPGPKMIWQFGELGYDVNIDFNGRLGEKPVRWNYVDKANRADLFRVFAALNLLKQNYSEFSEGDFTYALKGKVKSYQLSNEGEHVIAIGNFDVQAQPVSIDFPKTGTWYNYFAQSTIELSSPTLDFNLEPGEYLLLTTREMEQPRFSIRLDDQLIDEALLHVYPNPVGNWLIIEGEQLNKVGIYNLSGQQLMSWDAQPTVDRTRLDVTSLKNGIYLLRAEQKNGHSFSRRILKQ